MVISSNRKNGLLVETVEGAESIKTAHGDWQLAGRWKDLVAEVSEADEKIRHYSAWSQNLTVLLQQAGYVALVRARKVGLGLTAYIQVRMAKPSGGDKRSPLDLFAAAVQGWSEVVECVSLTGEMDCLLKVMVADMDHFTRFVMESLLKHPSVQDCKTSFVMKAVKGNVSLV